MEKINFPFNYRILAGIYLVFHFSDIKAAFP